MTYNYKDMDLLTRLGRLRALYKLMLPGAPAPTAETLQYWSRYEMQYVEHAIVRAASKVTAGMSLESIARYISAVARDEQRNGAR